jgi:3-oxoacyl-[acyl-carrier protein] reductase
MRFKGKVALITGASRGIGVAIAHTLAREGAAVVLADIDEEGMEQAAEEIRGRGQTVMTGRVDVGSFSDVQTLVDEALKRFGRINVLVNNAGIIRRGSFVDHPPEEWETVIRVNLGGTYNFCRAVVPHMIERKSGKIVNISSVAGKVGDLASAPSYGTSKGAINAFTKGLARDLAVYGITVNAVAPHAIETDMSRQWSEEKRRQIIESIPLRKLGQPEDVAEAVAFLASDAASFITGEILDVNGGYLMD